MEQTVQSHIWHVPEIKVSYVRTKGIPFPKITSSRDCYEAFLSSWDMNLIELQEQFKFILLNRALRAFGIFTLSSGGITASIVDTRLLFGIALKAMATHIAIAHNHPSGNLLPSTRDTLVTHDVVELGKLHAIKVIDHLIISPDGYYSFADEGRL